MRSAQSLAGLGREGRLPEQREDEHHEQEQEHKVPHLHHRRDDRPEKLAEPEVLGSGYFWWDLSLVCKAIANPRLHAPIRRSRSTSLAPRPMISMVFLKLRLTSGTLPAASRTFPRLVCNCGSIAPGRPG